MKRISGKLNGGTAVTYGYAPSAYGEVMVAFLDGDVCFLTFTAGGRPAAMQELKAFWPEAEPVQDDKKAVKAAAEIFSGADVGVCVRGTDMQVSVWNALITVLCGETISYTELAGRAGYPHAVRAVASAVARNPVPIIIPCHRIVRKSGEVGNFRYGSPMKKAILQDEKEMQMKN